MSKTEKSEPTLADALNEGRGGRLDNGYQGAITAVSDAIGEAERFVFSYDALDACQHLAESKPSSLLEATKFCRVPFERVWIEWSRRPHLLGQKDPNGNSFPKKQGVLIECLDDSFKRFGITLIWIHQNDAQNSIIKNYVAGENIIQICPVSFIVNWHDKWPVLDPLYNISGVDNLNKADIKFCNKMKRYENGDVERRAARDLLVNRVPSVCPYMDGYLRTVENKIGGNNKKIMREAAMNDWAGEYEIIIAMLCLLNSKNCVEKSKIDMAAINKSRKKAGKRELIGHSKVTINLSKSEANCCNYKNMSVADVRQHIVRGHFKIRNGGVFWWRPFLRGNASIGVVKRTGYSVVNKTQNAF